MLTVILNKKVERIHACCICSPILKLKSENNIYLIIHYSGKLLQACCIFFLIIGKGKKIWCLKSHSLSYLQVFKYLSVPPEEALPAKPHLSTQSSYYKRKKNSMITSFSPPVFKDPIELLPPLQKLCLTPIPTASRPQSMFPQSHKHSYQHHQKH